MCGFRFANVLQATSPLSLLQGVLRCILQVYLVRLVANRIDRRGERLRLLRDAFFGAPHRRLLGAPLPHPISMAFWAPRAHCRRRPRATLGRGLVRGRRLLHMPSIPFHANLAKPGTNAREVSPRGRLKQAKVISKKKDASPHKPNIQLPPFPAAARASLL